MSVISVEESDAAICSNLLNMEEEKEYVLNQFWFSEMNRLRKENSLSPIPNINDYKFVRRGEKLLLNGREIFDFKNKKNLAFAFTLASFTFALFALQNNGLEKFNNNKDACEGKVVEIDGKKYKLTLL